MLLNACLTFLTASSVFSAVANGEIKTPTPPATVTASLNAYMDKVFANIVNNATSLNIEPLSLPNVTKPLTSKWYFPYTHLNLTAGTLLNLQSMKRHGDCQMSYGNGTIEIRVDAAFSDLQVDYDFEALSSYSWFSLSGLLHGEVGETQVYADITVDADTLVIKAKEITFPGTKKIDFCIRSTILATWVVNAILEVVSLFSGLIVDDAQDAVTAAFNEFFEKEFPHMITQPLLKIDFCIRSTILATWVVNAILEVVSLFSGLIVDDAQDAVTAAFNEFFEKEFPHMITQPLLKIDFCIRSTILATWVVNAILEVVSLFSGLIVDDAQDAVTAAFNEFFEKEFPHMITQPLL